MKSKRMLWAINPFQEEESFFRHGLKVVGEFAAARGFEVEPVFVLAPTNLFTSTGMVALAEDADARAFGLWRAQLKGNKSAKSFLPPKVLTDDGLSNRHMAMALCRYARQTDAVLIAVATHGRKGVARAFMGSFAESLLHQAEVPTFVFNPTVKKGGAIKKVLFPVELPFQHDSAFEQVLEMAKSLKAKLVLYHKVDYVTQYTASTLHGTPWYQEYFDRDVAERRAAMIRMLQKARAAVPTELVFDDKAGPVPERIIAVAKKTKANLIAAVATTGPVEAAILGSIVRQVVRTAACPVWVIRAAKQAKRRAPSAKVRASATA